MQIEQQSINNQTKTNENKTKQTHQNATKPSYCSDDTGFTFGISLRTIVRT